MQVLVNLSHSLSPEAQSVFEVAADDIIYRLDTNYNPNERELYIKNEDLPRIINTFADHN